jgi:hypothetical protein
MTKPKLHHRALPMTVAVLSVLALSACDSADKGPKTAEQAKEEAAKLDRPTPGQYKQTMTITKFEIPGAPPEMTAQMKTAMAQAQEHTFCMTEAMADEGFREMFDKVGDEGECTYDRFDVSGGRLDAVLSCQNPREGKAQITMAGTVGENGSDVTVTVNQQGGEAPMANAQIAMHMVSQRIGDCPAAK